MNDQSALGGASLRPIEPLIRPWYSQRDLARRYHVNPVTIWRWVRQGKFPPAKEVGPNLKRWPHEVIAAHEASLPTVEWAGAGQDDAAA
jgi:prophage regulatory protein